MKILLFGSSGTIGRHIATEALSRGHEIVGVQRSEQRENQPFEVVHGDIRSSEGLLTQHRPDVVVSAVGAAPMSERPDYSIYRDAAEAITEAIRTVARPAPRLIVVGGAGGLITPAGDRLVDTKGFPSEFRLEALAQIDALDFYRSVDDVDWAYVSPAAVIQEGERKGRYRLGANYLLVDSQSNSLISISDYAVAFLDIIENPSSGGRLSVAY